jgi:4-oxalocrotonate tautomerase
LPYLSVRLGARESEQTTARIVALLTDLTAEVLKKKRELTAVAVEYVRPDRWFIGGSSLAVRGTASFCLDIKVTEGSNTKDEKGAFVQRVFAGLEAAVGQLEPASYIVIHEVRADAWGYGGATQEYRYVEGKRL